MLRNTHWLKNFINYNFLCIAGMIFKVLFYQPFLTIRKYQIKKSYFILLQKIS